MHWVVHWVALVILFIFYTNGAAKLIILASVGAGFAARFLIPMESPINAYLYFGLGEAGSMFVLDLAYRLLRPNGHWWNEKRGAHILGLPVWLWGVMSGVFVIAMWYLLKDAVASLSGSPAT